MRGREFTLSGIEAQYTTVEWNRLQLKEPVMREKVNPSVNWMSLDLNVKSSIHVTLCTQSEDTFFSQQPGLEISLCVSSRTSFKQS